MIHTFSLNSLVSYLYYETIIELCHEKITLFPHGLDTRNDAATNGLQIGLQGILTIQVKVSVSITCCFSSSSFLILMIIFCLFFEKLRSHLSFLSKIITKISASTLTRKFSQT